MQPLRFIQSLIVTINLGFSFLFVVSSFSDSVSPNQSMLFSYMGLLFPFFFVINFCFVLYWLIARKWMMLFVITCSFFICWQPVTRYLPFHPFQAESTQKNAIKVLTYNVMAFGYKDHTKEDPNPILQYIIDSGADIVCLQEYFIANNPNFLTQQKIEKALNMYPYNHTIPLVKKRNYTIGLAIYSKYPILSSRKIRYDSAFNGSTVHEIEVNGEKVCVINNHLESFKLTTEDRSNYAEFVNHINMNMFDELRETVQQKLGTAFLIRAEQAEIVAEEIQKLNAKYLIVCGDYNDTPISYAYRVIKSSMGDAFAEAGTGLGMTYNQHYFWFRIDHIIHSTNIKTCKAKIDKIPLSDHYPVWCDLELQ